MTRSSTRAMIVESGRSAPLSAAALDRAGVAGALAGFPLGADPLFVAASAMTPYRHTYAITRSRSKFMTSPEVLGSWGQVEQTA